MLDNRKTARNDGNRDWLVLEWRKDATTASQCTRSTQLSSTIERVRPETGARQCGQKLCPSSQVSMQMSQKLCEQFRVIAFAHTVHITFTLGDRHLQWARAWNALNGLSCINSTIQRIENLRLIFLLSFRDYKSRGDSHIQWSVFSIAHDKDIKANFNAPMPNWLLHSDSE